MKEQPWYDEQIKELSSKGLTALAIAKEIGCSLRTVHRGRKRLGIAKPAVKKMTVEEKMLVKSFVQQGYSINSIARIMGRSFTTISNFVAYGCVIPKCP